jgi:hypothetical protein
MNNEEGSKVGYQQNGNKEKVPTRHLLIKASVKIG